MEKRYWNELSNNEISKIENEWNNSDWKKHAVENSKKDLKERGYNIAYILEMISLVFVILSIIRMFILLANNSLDDNIEGPITISMICFFTFGITANHLRKKYQYKYIDNEYEKWLLKRHNIVK